MTGTEPGKSTILHVILSLEIGGMEQVVADLVRNLDKRRFVPVVACIQSLGPIAEELIADGISVVLLPAMTPIVSFLYAAPLRKIMRESGASVVHVHSGCLYKTVVAARLAGIRKVIYTVHGKHLPERNSINVLDRIFSGWTSRVVAVSRELAEYLHWSVGVPQNKITLIQNGIRVDAFNGPPDRHPRKELVIGIVARLAPVKDIPTLLHAMQIVVKECPDVVLQIVGDGSERQSLEQLSQSLGITKHVVFLGSRRDIPAVLAGIDIFVLSSLSEGTSVTLLEAMASGKPVVVTRVGGNPSLVEQERNGFLVPPGRPDELAEALLKLVGNPHLRASMGDQNRKKAVEEFGVIAMVRQYESLYAERSLGFARQC
jgi:sugar transferase (PEP-CTERM/EpsH1 system associated)